MHLIFDCDGVLVDSERLVNRVEARVLSRWGWDATPDELGATFKGRAFPEVAASIARHVQRPLPPDWMYDLAMEVADGMRRELREIPGVRSVLDRLRDAGVPLAVASQSALGRVRLSLGVCGLDGYFGAHLYTASMVARPKPAPDVYLHAAAGLGADPSDCIVVEDSPSGVRAACAAGMRVYGYAADEDADALEGAGAIVIRNMAELPERLGLR
jgi:HAD superfamily hydrolase (TIGR01509 family)